KKSCGIGTFAFHLRPSFGGRISLGWRVELPSPPRVGCCAAAAVDRQPRSYLPLPGAEPSRRTSGGANEPASAARFALALDAERDIDRRPVLGDAVVLDHRAHRHDV